MLISPKVFGPGSTHSTFSSNPQGTAMGLEVMKIIEESDFATEVPRKGKYFVSRLKALQKKYPQIGDVDGLGLALRMEMCEKDGYTPNKKLTDAIEEIGLTGKLTAGGKHRGLVLDVGGYYKNVFTMAPSLYITEKEIDLGVDLFEEALKLALKRS
jgi:4-aminobutyrate aminotransferase-like enzyme